jgi:hypothetical protein
MTDPAPTQQPADPPAEPAPSKFFTQGARPHYMYDLDLDPQRSGPSLAVFRYTPAVAPHDDDTTFELNGPSWVELGSPERIRVHITAHPA